MNETRRARVVMGDCYRMFPPALLAAFDQAGYDVVDAERCEEGRDAAIRSAAALVVLGMPVNADLISEMTCCRHILRAGTGYDNIDAAAARARGIAVSNVPDYCTDEVADHAMAMAMSLMRQLPALDRSIRQGGWPRYPAAPMPAPHSLTFGTLGLGRIGKAVQRREGAFGFRQTACDPYLTEEEFEREGVTAVSLDWLMTGSDVLSLHVPLTGETQGIIDADRIRQMKPGAILINTSRGPVLDGVAAAHALQTGSLAGAGIDVYDREPLPEDHPLRSAPNVILTPHIAWYSIQSGPKLLTLAVEEVLRALRGEPLRCCVNGAGN